jgi:galactokinase
VPEATGWAPGRVNLIGEHTDYNGGFVLPVALTLGVRVALDRAPELTVVGPATDERSAAYVSAVCRSLAVPARLAVRLDGDLPARAGLGSSGALEVAVARALRNLWALPVVDQRLALGCHWVENNLIGVRCGIMDQLTSAVGSPGHALLIDCTAISYREVRLPRWLELAVLDSGTRHSNAASGYNERRAECEEAARLMGVATLRELGPAANRGAPDYGALPEPLDRRVRHVYEENIRVGEAVAAIELGNAAALAGLLRASHASQRDLFEVSTPEIDQLVERAERAGALGARLTGGGFGGAVLALCRPGDAARVAAEAGAPLMTTVGWDA